MSYWLFTLPLNILDIFWGSQLHIPVVLVLRFPQDQYSLRETRHLDFICQFTTDIRCIDGSSNFVADALYRPDGSQISASAICFLSLAKSQRIPGEFLPNSLVHLSPDTSYVTRLKNHMLHIKPSLPRIMLRPEQVHRDLRTCPFVFIRVGSLKTPLRPPYDSPFGVLDRVRLTAPAPVICEAQRQLFEKLGLPAVYREEFLSRRQRPKESTDSFLRSSRASFKGLQTVVPHRLRMKHLQTILHEIL
ncbi:uncharacterized protein DEA37_0006946 [Paragonimus westermani]|uniref:Uncharacterized protein n=1 Tax=Paragonimus westermani TaxID=34504 RepID=A0A5J4NIQ7_9TREM|nr:uncharacterized protein DEA37_0006946 [Paragonimus westermani]